jgi:hypothetical protein
MNTNTEKHVCLKRLENGLKDYPEHITGYAWLFTKTLTDLIPELDQKELSRLSMSQQALTRFMEVNNLINEELNVMRSIPEELYNKRLKMVSEILQ